MGYNAMTDARKLMKGGRYDYTYDRWSRLTEAKYTPEEGGAEDYSASYGYDELGRPLTIRRSGVLAYDGATPYYSTIDDMALSYDGATLKSVTDKTDYWSDEDLPDEAEFYGMVGYPGSVMEDTFSYTFNSEGLLTNDEARNISNITYDNFGNLRMQTKHLNQRERYEEHFEYGPDGSRLRHKEVHIRPGSIGPSIGGTTRPGFGGGLVPDVETVLADRRYIGPFTFNADTLERVDFPGGYFDYSGKAHYMIRDWNSSVNMVVNAEGFIEQHTCYYPYGEPWGEPEGQPYLYAGKERMRFLSKGDSDFGPRAYNAATLQWWAPDRLASDTPWLSPYSYCAANPNRYSDLSGFRFTPREQLLMAKAAYPDEYDASINILQNECSIEVSSDFSYVPREADNGFSSILFERALENGGKEYAYAFKGTEIFSKVDWVENLEQLQGFSSHYMQAVENADKLSLSIGRNDELNFVGHSKGGGEAAAASMATGHPAYTFNPAAVSKQTIKELNLGPANNVTNYIAFGMKLNVDIRAFGDIVYNLQKNLLNIRPPGNSFFFPTQNLFSHSISTFGNIPYFNR